ncbi:MAG: hypothetical protein HC862_03160 [Scytonema sp. RU_4_4]|nr:hypothetical protein [Scytonema sp. RU_4_4]NJR74351.1 hypothetical protein [Scytonema sp. CRU_2_7]
MAPQVGKPARAGWLPKWSIGALETLLLRLVSKRAAGEELLRWMGSQVVGVSGISSSLGS